MDMQKAWKIAGELPNELAKATGVSATAFTLISLRDYQRAFKDSPHAFKYYHYQDTNDGFYSEEFEFAPDIIPYLDGTIEWNATNERFEGCFWGEVELPGYKLLGWITVDASYADNYQPIQYEVHDVIDLETSESDPDHSLFRKILMVADTLMKVDYEI